MHRREFVRGCLAGATAVTAGSWRRPGGAQAARPVRVAVFSGLNAFDPVRPFTEAFIVRAVFPPLVRVTRKSNAPLDGWEPFAATPSSVKRDGSRLYIEIKAEPQLIWSGGGNNTAREIMRGIERARARRAADALDNIAALEVKDDLVCRAYLRRADTRLYKEVFARTWTTPLTEAGERMLTSPQRRLADALGPYGFVDPFTPGDTVTLKANPYWKGKTPGIGQFSFRRFKSEDGAVAEFHAKELELVLFPTGRFLASSAELARQYGGLAEVEVKPIDSVTYLAVDAKEGATADPRVRQAARAAVDPVQVAKVAYGPDGARPTSDILPAGFAEQPSGSRWFDPARARRLLAEAGRSEGINGSLLLRTGATEEERRAAESVRDQLRQVAIRLEVEERPPVASTRDRSPSTFILARTPLVQTAVGVLADFKTNAPGNLPRMSNAQFDAAVEQLEQDFEGGTRLLSRTQELLEQEAVAIPICQETRAVVRHRDLRTAFAPDGTLGDLLDFSWG